jgi:type I restriction enzyme R subunit
VEKAFQKVTAGKSFSPEQEQWLDAIKAHLVANLTVDQEDLDSLPLFTRRGGLSQANRVFAGTLDDLLKELNEAIAA